MGQLNGAKEHMSPGGCESQHRNKEHYEPRQSRRGPAAGPEGIGRAKQLKGRNPRGGYQQDQPGIWTPPCYDPGSATE